jgi:hypothetical protein
MVWKKNSFLMLLQMEHTITTKPENGKWLSEVYPDTVRIYMHVPDRCHAHVAM